MVMKKVAMHKCLKFIVNLIMWTMETQKSTYGGYVEQLCK